MNARYDARRTLRSFLAVNAHNLGTSDDLTKNVLNGDVAVQAGLFQRCMGFSEFAPIIHRFDQHSNTIIEICKRPSDLVSGIDKAPRSFD